MTTLKTTSSLILAGALFTAACGDSKSSMLPTAPSAVADPAQALEAGDPDAVSGANAKGGNGKDKDKDKDKNKNGNGNGNGNDNGNGNGNGRQPSAELPPTLPGNNTPGNTTPPVPSTKTVQLEGLISAKGSNTITVNSQVVSVPSSAVIRHGSRTYKFSDLRVGNRVHVKATRTAVTAAIGALAPAVSSATTLVATEVKVQNPSDPRESGEDDPAANMLVSVMATDPTASETGPQTGTFTITRAGDLTAPLTITFTLNGTATRGADYTTTPVFADGVPLTVTIGPGLSTATVTITPVADADEVSETVTLTVVDGDGYTAGAPATATVTISS
jgi:hypothetical protein